MSKRIWTRISQALALGSLVLTGASAAHAEDGKVYPGSNCHAYNSASGNITQYGFNYVENTSTSNSALLICPIVKDEVSSLLGVNLIRVRYYKPSDTGFYCSMHSKTATGTGGFTSSQWDFDGAGTKTMTLDNVLSYSEGSYQLYCILPNKVGSNTAKLHTYRIDEN